MMTTLGWKSLVVSLLLLMVFAIGFLVSTSGPGEDVNRVQARNELQQIVAAVRSFREEYGTNPVIRPDGKCDTEETNGSLMRILRGLDRVQNPRGICFIEFRAGKKRGAHYRSGFDPEYGAWWDPWGSIYRVRITSDPNEQVENPFDLSDDESKRLHGAIAWSLGRDRKQGNPKKPRVLRGSDDIVSWQ